MSVQKREKKPITVPIPTPYVAYNQLVGHNWEEEKKSQLSIKIECGLIYYPDIHIIEFMLYRCVKVTIGLQDLPRFSSKVTTLEENFKDQWETKIEMHFACVL